MKRRGFLASILAAGVAPAFIGSGVLMPIKRIILPSYHVHRNRNDPFGQRGYIDSEFWSGAVLCNAEWMGGGGGRELA